MAEDHTSFIKTPKQLLIVVVLAFGIPIALIGLATQLITSMTTEPSEQSEAAILNRIRPVGQVTLAEAGAPKGNLNGEQIYQTVCKTCHEAGIAGAPKFGDKAAWASRIKQGVDTLYAHALKGTDKGMPPKGGNPDLADVEVERAVVYMANHSGAAFKEPPAPAPSPAAPPAAAAPVAAAVPQTATAVAPTPQTTAAAGAPATAAGAPLDTKSGLAMMQKEGCSACHAVDKKIVGPAYEDVAAKYRNDKSAEAKLVQKVKTGGSGVWGQVPMPPNSAVPDQDIKALVAWILTLKK
ncbi:MAG TPA: c-type cytochrome [Casimicrobiaceae bacterium]|nr:c-type cytochrome [Casimicrobiaceae bacterium]